MRRTSSGGAGRCRRPHVAAAGRAPSGSRRRSLNQPRRRPMRPGIRTSIGARCRARTRQRPRCGTGVRHGRSPPMAASKTTTTSGRGIPMRSAIRTSIGARCRAGSRRTRGRGAGSGVGRIAATKRGRTHTSVRSSETRMTTEARWPVSFPPGRRGSPVGAATMQLARRGQGRPKAGSVGPDVVVRERCSMRSVRNAAAPRRFRSSRRLAGTCTARRVSMRGAPPRATRQPPAATRDTKFRAGHRIDRGESYEGTPSDDMTCVAERILALRSGRNKSDG